MSKSASRARLAEIIRKRSFGRGEITLASGRKSDFYFNLKPTMLDPEGATLLAELTYETLKDDQLDFVGGLEMGAVPLAVMTGQGSEMRRPLGIAIVGGLFISQILTLYTTPVVYIYLDRLRLWCIRLLSRVRRVSREGVPVQG